MWFCSAQHLTRLIAAWLHAGRCSHMCIPRLSHQHLLPLSAGYHNRTLSNGYCLLHGSRCCLLAAHTRIGRELQLSALWCSAPALAGASVWLAGLSHRRRGQAYSLQGMRSTASYSRKSDPYTQNKNILTLKCLLIPPTPQWYLPTLHHRWIQIFLPLPLLEASE